MHKITAVLFSTLLLLGSASASDELDVVRTVRQFIDSFNKGDLKAALNTCAAQSAIIDEFPPYAWQGTMGCADWLRDFDAYAKKNGITNPKAILGRSHVDVTEGSAYTVTPTRFTFKKNGKRSSEQGLIVAVLQNTSNSWRITSWAWAKQ
jgi:hypothetical protein